ncbi:MAG TPA: sigma-70 family RNA polymerase sigma factor [Actinomycetota bacterium]|nr:sigma-70 family RNA polymerase sigma factor [Actinomycetota bacterium]
MDLTTFCESEYPKLVGLLGLWCGDRQVGEELAQETLARVWQRWPRVKTLDNPHAWAHRVALNLARSHVRRRFAEKRARERTLAQRPEQIEPGDVATSMSLKAAISSLSRRKRSALILHYYLDLPFKDVAEIMEIPESTAKSLGRRAVQDLRKVLAEPESREVWDAT